MSIVARAATQVCNGPATDTLIMSSTPVVAKALCARAARGYDNLLAGQSVADVVRALDEERHPWSTRGSECLSTKSGQTITVHFTTLAKGARRSSKMASRWLAFDQARDAYVDHWRSDDHHGRRRQQGDSRGSAGV